MKHLEHYLCFSYSRVLMFYLYYRSMLHSLSFRKKEKAKCAQMAFLLVEEEEEESAMRVGVTFAFTKKGVDKNLFYFVVSPTKKINHVFNIT